MPVNTPNSDYSTSIAKWTRCRDCYEGTDAVKAAGTLYLPMLDSHQKNPSRYTAYVKRAEFFNATARTVDGFAGGMLQKAPMVEVPEAIEPHTADVTLAGSSLEGFALDLAREVLLTGRAGVLVDMPADGALEARPYWVLYRAEDIISWKSQRISGVDTVIRIVLEEHVDLPGKDEFSDEETCQYRVLSLNPQGLYQQQVWRKAQKDGKDEWIIVETVLPVRIGRPLDFIPFCFVGPDGLSSAVQKSPVIDLVDLNLSHYRTMADLEHGRHLTALPTPWVSGMSVNGQSDVGIGSGTLWLLEKGGQAGMLEYTGQGLGALERADADKRKKMAVLGSRLLEEQAGSGAETASAVGMRHSGEHATLRKIAQVVERSLTIALQWHSFWAGAGEVPDEIEAKVELNKEYFSVTASAQDIQALLLALQAETISYATFYARLQSGGWAREGVSMDEELEDIADLAGSFAPPLAGAPAAGSPAQPGGDGSEDPVEPADEPAGAAGGMED